MHTCSTVVTINSFLHLFSLCVAKFAIQVRLDHGIFAAVLHTVTKKSKVLVATNDQNAVTAADYAGEEVGRSPTHKPSAWAYASSVT